MSKIENGQTASAVATLSKISDALNIPLSWALDDQPETDLILLTTQDRQPKIDDVNMGYSYELLARSRFSAIEPTIVHVTPKDQNVRHEPYTHTEDEFIYVLKGEIELFYQHTTYFMTEGDTAHFNGNKPHLFMPVDNQGAQLLTVFIEKQ